MTVPPNRFKSALKEHRPQIGLWAGLASPYTAEICATAGFDWLLLDGEHAPNDLRTLLAQLQAIAPYSTHAVTRAPVGETTLLKQYLDIGCTTLLIPMVESEDQAKSLVRAVRYPPGGDRGVGAALARASRWNAYDGYLKDANEQICLLLQVESIAGLNNLDAIVSVEGVDGVFVGPSDLAASMGHIGNAAHPDVQSAVREAAARILAAGKAPGILTADQDLARDYLAMGFVFVAVGIDTSLLAGATRALAARYKPSLL